MRCFFSIKEGYNKKIVGIVDLDGGVVDQLNLFEYKISMNLENGDPQLKEILIEKKEETNA